MVKNKQFHLHKYYLEMYFLSGHLLPYNVTAYCRVQISSKIKDKLCVNYVYLYKKLTVNLKCYIAFKIPKQSDDRFGFEITTSRLRGHDMKATNTRLPSLNIIT